VSNNVRNSSKQTTVCDLPIWITATGFAASRKTSYMGDLFGPEQVDFWGYFDFLLVRK